MIEFLWRLFDLFPGYVAGFLVIVGILLGMLIEMILEESTEKKLTRIIRQTTKPDCKMKNCKFAKH